MPLFEDKKISIIFSYSLRPAAFDINDLEILSIQTKLSFVMPQDAGHYEYRQWRSNLF